MFWFVGVRGHSSMRPEGDGGVGGGVGGGWLPKTLHCVTSGGGAVMDFVTQSRWGGIVIPSRTN